MDWYDLVYPISIHAPLTGSDAKLHSSQACKLISIHAPLTGSDKNWTFSTKASRRFQSTLPSQGATHHDSADKIQNHISIHAPLTGSDDYRVKIYCSPSISIHAPLTGSDSKYTHKIPL